MSPDLSGIIFMGTPDFAVPTLKRLLDAGIPVLTAVTQPDRPKGRGKRRTAPPVKILAEESKIPIYQPERIRAQEAIETLQSVRAECAVVVAYGQILPKAFLDLFPLGVLNVHASLLPRYRGAAPIHRAILAGDALTGVTIMLLDPGMDTGPVLSKREVPIHEDDTFGTLHDKLGQAGADLLVETLDRWRTGRIQPVPQDDASATYAPPIRKEELRLAWDSSAQEVVNRIRAFDPWPGAYAVHEGKRIKCYGASVLDWRVEGLAGDIVGQVEKGLVVVAGDNRCVAVGELQLEGQRRLPAAEFLRGRPELSGSRLE